MTYARAPNILTPDGQYLVLGTEVSTVRVVRASDGVKVGTFGPFGVRAVAVSPDGQYFAATGHDYWSDLPEARVWRMSDGALVQKLSGMGLISDSISYTPDGRHLAVGDWGGLGRPGAVWLWKTSDWTLARKFETPGASSIYTHAFSPDGQLLATGGGDAKVRLWRTSDWALVRTLAGNGYPVYSLAFSPDGGTLAVSTDTYGANLQLWRVGDGTLLRSFGAADAFSSRVAFSPDGGTLVSSSSSMLWFWNVGDGELIRAYVEDVGWTWPSSPAFSPDGRLLGVGRFDQTVCVMRLRTPAEEGEEIVPPEPPPVFFLPLNPLPPPEEGEPPGVR